jgi:predicted metal-dependent phosphoesterase TrpH
MYRYETHMHTNPVSRCAVATVRESLTAYRDMGYQGVFVTNHFVDGNVRIDRNLPYEERLEFFFSDYEEAVEIGKELGIDVFCGAELTLHGTDFLVYGLSKEWYFAHPECVDMPRTKLLKMMCEEGALVIQAHPFRLTDWIDHVRLFPHCVHGFETYNACRTEFENHLAEVYCNEYGLIHFAGSDNHVGPKQSVFGGMESETPIRDVEDFIERVKNGTMKPFRYVKE